MRHSQSLLLALLAVIAILLIAGCKAGQQPPPQASAPLSEQQAPPQPPELPAAPPAETGQEEAEKIEAVTSNEVRMTIYHTGYEPSAIKVKKGSTMKIMATAQPVAHRHGITIDEFGVNEPVLSADENNPTVVTFIPTQAGMFKIYCRTCWDGPFGRDHPDIQATLIVE